MNSAAKTKVIPDEAFYPFAVTAVMSGQESKTNQMLKMFSKPTVV